MDDRETSLCDRCFVILSHDPALIASVTVDATGPKCIHTDSSYLAASELLSAPAIALIIDLRLFSQRHIGLLQIAKQRGLEILAVGPLPASMTADDLSGVRLVSHTDLLETIESLDKTQLAIPEPPEDTQELVTEDITPPEQQTAPVVRLTPAKKSHIDDITDLAFASDSLDELMDKHREIMVAVRPTQDSGTSSNQATKKTPKRTIAQEANTKGRSDELLTPQEIDALLGNES